MAKDRAKGQIGDASLFCLSVRDAAFADPRRATRVGPHFEPSTPPSARAFRDFERALNPGAPWGYRGRQTTPVPADGPRQSGTLLPPSGSQLEPRALRTRQDEASMRAVQRAGISFFKCLAPGDTRSARRPPSATPVMRVDAIRPALHFRELEETGNGREA
jgi:hypothetical protein